MPSLFDYGTLFEIYTEKKLYEAASVQKVKNDQLKFMII